VEVDARVVVALAVENADWASGGRAYKVFDFGAEETVVLMRDCLDESSALDLLED